MMRGLEHFFFGKRRITKNLLFCVQNRALFGRFCTQGFIVIVARISSVVKGKRGFLSFLLSAEAERHTTSSRIFSILPDQRKYVPRKWFRRQ